MTNNVTCKCGTLHGNVQMVKAKFVLNSRHKKDNGLKFQLAYNVTGSFVLENGLIRCVECGEYALTSADWQALNELKQVGASTGKSACATQSQMDQPA